MLLSELKSTKIGKELSIIQGVELNKGLDVPQEILMADTLFKAFSKSPVVPVPNSSTENHLLFMFKLLYIFNIPFSNDSIPILTKLYVKYTHGQIETIPRKTPRKNLQFQFLAEEDIFAICVSSAREVLFEVRPDWKTGLGYTQGIDLCERFFEISSILVRGQTTTAMLQAEFNDVEKFDLAIKNKQAVFYKEGFYYFPVIEIKDEGVEDFVWQS